MTPIIELIVIIPGEDVLLHRAPPTTRSVVHSHSHSTIQACKFASACHLIVQHPCACMAGTLPAMTSRYKHKYLSKRATDTSGSDKDRAQFVFLNAMKVWVVAVQFRGSLYYSGTRNIP